jgi:hypothetical protein
MKFTFEVVVKYQSIRSSCVGLTHLAQFDFNWALHRLAVAVLYAFFGLCSLGMKFLSILPWIALR